MPVCEPVLRGNGIFAYRDPACIFHEGKYHLFMTVSEKADGYMYNRLGMSVSSDPLHFPAPRLLTPRDRSLNFCSPGSIVAADDGTFIICVTSYPMPEPYAVRPYADATARLFFIRTRDFDTFSVPEPVAAKGDTPFAGLGRMIDPFLFRDRDDSGLYHLFFKQNGVSHSVSRDLKHWQLQGFFSGGENACVLPWDDGYLLIHSPANGIGIKFSRDLAHWEDRGIRTLDQEKWPWASGRLTAAFALEAPADIPYRYLVFFHGSAADSVPETHGNASVAAVGTDDFERFYCLQ